MQSTMDTHGFTLDDIEALGLHVRGGDMVDVLCSCERKKRRDIIHLQDRQLQTAIAWVQENEAVRIVFAATDRVQMRNWMRRSLKKSICHRNSSSCACALLDSATMYARTTALLSQSLSAANYDKARSTHSHTVFCLYRFNLSKCL